MPTRRRKWREGLKAKNGCATTDDECVDRHENIFLYKCTHVQIALRPIFMKRTTRADGESVKKSSRRGIFWNLNPLNAIYNFYYCFLKTETMNKNMKVCVRTKKWKSGRPVTQNICIAFIQRRPNVCDVGPTLYNCYKMFCVYYSKIPDYEQCVQVRELTRRKDRSDLPFIRSLITSTKRTLVTNAPCFCMWNWSHARTLFII